MSSQWAAQHITDEGFNKYAFRDRDGLPEWFHNDGSQHSKLQKPMTKAAAEAIKEKMRVYNARPIKKVQEAKARKKFKAAQRLEKMKKQHSVHGNWLSYNQVSLEDAWGLDSSFPFQLHQFKALRTATSNSYGRKILSWGGRAEAHVNAYD
ncbi:Spb1 C-terminal domain-containing protein [Xylaria acuta]|nr:Spb1 C-terminal domain-containing protein [Xylaria acuta]